MTSVLAPPKRILTVEDNAIVSADVRAILEDAGYDVVPDARDGVAGSRARARLRARPDPARPHAAPARRRRSRQPDSPRSPTRRSSSSPGRAIPTRSQRASAAGTSGLVRKPFSAHGLLCRAKSPRRARADDFGLRCLVEEMVSQGADERDDRAGVARMYRCRPVRGAPHRPAAYAACGRGCRSSTAERGGQEHLHPAVRR